MINTKEEQVAKGDEVWAHITAKWSKYCDRKEYRKTFNPRSNLFRLYESMNLQGPIQMVPARRFSNRNIFSECTERNQPIHYGIYFKNEAEHGERVYIVALALFLLVSIILSWCNTNQKVSCCYHLRT